MQTQRSTAQQKELLLNKIPIFLAQAYRIIDNPSNCQVIGWAEDGSSFMIKNVSELVNTIFPSYFKHSNFNSFVRQLHSYGFEERAKSKSQNIFIHEFFQKDAIHLLPFIKKKKIKNLQPQTTPENQEQNNLVVSKEKNKIGENSLFYQKHPNLEKLVSLLIEQNHYFSRKNFFNQQLKIDEQYRRKIYNLLIPTMVSLQTKENPIFSSQKSTALFHQEIKDSSHFVQLLNMGQNKFFPLEICQNILNKKEVNIELSLSQKDHSSASLEQLPLKQFPFNCFPSQHNFQCDQFKISAPEKKE